MVLVGGWCGQIILNRETHECQGKPDRVKEFLVMSFVLQFNWEMSFSKNFRRFRIYTYFSVCLLTVVLDNDSKTYISFPPHLNIS